MAYDGKTLELARELANLTQGQLAQILDCGERSIRRWEEIGLSDRSPYTRMMERELRLTDPMVLRAIQARRDEKPVDVDPAALSDTALADLLDAVTDEVKTRIKTRFSTQPVRLQGQHAPYPSHLDEAPARRRSESGE